MSLTRLTAFSPEETMAFTMRRLQFASNNVLNDPLTFNRFQFGLPYPGDNPTDIFWQPAIDIFDDGKQYIVQVELPGVLKESVHIDVRSDTVQVVGEMIQRQEIQREQVKWQERRYGKFMRNIQLPQKVRSEQVVARHENGVLEIRLPKAEDSQVRKIRPQ